MDDILTEDEKAFMKMLLKLGRIILDEDAYDYMVGDMDTFDKNDLFNLACKFGLENDY